jgi:hypothetical protein
MMPGYTHQQQPPRQHQLLLHWQQVGLWQPATLVWERGPCVPGGLRAQPLQHHQPSHQQRLLLLLLLQGQQSLR